MYCGGIKMVMEWIKKFKRIDYSVYLDESGEIIEVDMNCSSNCADECKYRKRCDEITAVLASMAKK
jgi:hypothetical protein